MKFIVCYDCRCRNILSDSEFYFHEAESWREALAELLQLDISMFPTDFPIGVKGELEFGEWFIEFNNGIAQCYNIDAECYRVCPVEKIENKSKLST